VPIVLKSGSLNLLEPSGPVKACHGIALPLPLPLYLQEEQSLGAFSKLRKATISYVTSVCVSVRPHETTRLPLDGRCIYIDVLVHAHTYINIFIPTNVILIFIYNLK
jgi:hypothetical protein